MERTVFLNNKGVSLIEIMVALVILLIVSLALLQTALVGISTNLQNSLRNEAVQVVEMRMGQLRSQPFDSVVTGAETAVVRNFRGFTATYTPTRTITAINANSKQIALSVAWSYRGRNYTHGITSIMRKQ